MESKIAHLGFIQGVINRMGNNSFILKGWSVTIVAALFALSQGGDQEFVLLAYFPAIMFWLLDTFFLHQEKLFIELYNQVATDKINSNSFSLETSQVKNNIPMFWKIFFSKTLVIFHGLIILAILYVMFKETV